MYVYFGVEITEVCVPIQFNEYKSKMKPKVRICSFCKNTSILKILFHVVPKFLLKKMVPKHSLTITNNPTKSQPLQLMRLWQLVVIPANKPNKSVNLLSFLCFRDWHEGVISHYQCFFIGRN